MSRYLLVDDDAAFLQVLSRSLGRRQHEVSTAKNPEQALELAKTATFDRAIIDLKMVDASGLDLIAPLLEIQPKLSIVILTGYSSIATAVEAVKRGACNYLCKPASIDDILNAFAEQASEISVPEKPHSVDRLEWEHIQKILAENNGNVSATARTLGMHRRTLQRKLLKKPVQH